MGNWTICYAGAETVDGLESFEDCLTEVQRRFADRVHDINWRWPRRRECRPTTSWHVFDESNGAVLAELFFDYQ